MGGFYDFKEIHFFSIDFDHFDILQDEEVRERLKAHSNWPTYPQVYAHGELVGGLDVIKAGF